jgi:tRNA(Arg) A34 adenosine deaminase TadA
VESVFEILGSRRLNHHVDCEGGILAEESAQRLKTFFEARR